MSAPSSPRKKRLAFAAVTLVLASGLLFLAAEAALRLVRDHVDLWVLTGREIGPNPARDWGYVDAFCAYRGRPGLYADEKTHKSINSHGFISTPELSLEKDDGTLRIVFLGGSSTAGTGDNLADVDTWPWRAVELLRERFPGQRLEFINGALGGYSSFESFGRLWSRLRFYSPDIVVVYHGWNEMYYFDDEDLTRWRTLPDGSWSFDLVTSPITTYEPLWIDHVIRPSQLLTKVRLRLTQRIAGEVGAQAGELAQDYDRKGLDVFRTNLRLMREATELFGAQLLVAKQATLIVPGLSEEQQARCYYQYHGFDHEAHVDAFDQLYRIIDDEIAADNIIDTTTISGVPEYFHDHVHPTVAGAEKLAEIVASALYTELAGAAAGTDPRP